MSTISEVHPLSKKILKNHFLCDSCLGRLFAKKLKVSSNRILGKKLKKNISKTKECFICKNLFDNLAPFLKLMIDSSSDYGFSSFVVGAKLKPSIIERDDYIRSHYKLIGIDSIKTAITQDLSKNFSRKTNKNFDFLDPDLTFTINFKEETCHLRTKQISLQGRYKKLKRGIPQKQKPCMNCLGKGCRTCQFHGIDKFESIEGKISEILFQKFGGTIAKFSWIGGEDKSSLVLGSGRPFFVRIQNPISRKIKFSKILKLDSIEIHGLKVIHDIPKKPLAFFSTIQLEVNSENEIKSDSLKNLKKLKKIPIAVYENSGKHSEKKIFDIKYKKKSKNIFSINIEAEGGLPVKRFVSGDNVSPSISQIIKDKCTCEKFDFLQIQMITNN